MSSKQEDGALQENPEPNPGEEPETDSETPYREWERFLDESDLLEAYDTVIEIHDGKRYLERPEVESINDDEILPDYSAYEGQGESLEALREKLEGDTLIVAFDLEGKDLPGYHRLQNEGLDPSGNWWDNPESVDADYLFDRTTYSGAVDVPGFEETYTISGRDVYLIQNS